MSIATQREFDQAAQEVLKVVFDDLEKTYGDSVAVKALRIAAMDVVMKMRSKLYME